MLAKIVSGGQTGVDRAALDAARAAGLACGGWCPRNRRAEDGAIPDTYPLSETPDRAYRQRTEWNVRDSDATLILLRGALSGGTALTAQLARKRGRPLHIVQLDTQAGDADARAAAAEWIATNRIVTLNIAGPRESQRKGIHDAARAFLDDLIAAVTPQDI
jgi:hypothetical protein